MIAPHAAQVLLFIFGMVVLPLRCSAAARISMTPTLKGVTSLVWALALDVFVVITAAISLLVLVVEPTLGGIVLGVWAVAMIVPLPFAKVVLVPLGFMRPAFWLALLSHRTFWQDRVGGAMAVGAHALMKRKFPGESELAFLEQSLPAALLVPPADEAKAPKWARRLLFFMPPPSSANALLGAGLLSACRGDADGARNVLERIETLPPDRFSEEARRMAIEWRCADAAQRGDWALASRLGTDARLPRSAATLFLSAVAQRLLGDPHGPDDAALASAWRRAPRHRYTRPLLLRAIRATDTVRDTKPSTELEVRASAEEALRRALAGHVALSRVSPGAPSLALRRVAGLWDAVLGDVTLRASLTARAAELGVPESPITASTHDRGGVLDDLQRQVEDQLAALARRDGVPLAALTSGSASLRKVGRSLRDELLRHLEQSASALGRRVAELRKLPEKAELREFEAIVTQYRAVAAFGGIELRRLAFSMVHSTICGHGVWLWNERKLRRVANAIFRFLLVEAVVLDDEAAIALQVRNVRAGG